MNALFSNGIDGFLLAALGWLLIGSVGLAQPRRFTLISRVLFPLGAGVAALIAVQALPAMSAAPQTLALPLGLPGHPFHLRLDTQ